MLKTYRAPRYAARPLPIGRDATATRHPVVIVGAGPVGLSAALDCARRGLRVLLLDDNDTVSVGSRALCYAKRTLEIWDRLGVAGRMIDKGIQWQVGKVFRDTELVYRFDLLPERGHKMPAMINLQQYYLEEYLVDACEASGHVELRWKHAVTGLVQHDDRVALVVMSQAAWQGSASRGWDAVAVETTSRIRRDAAADFAGAAGAGCERKPG